MHTKGFAAGLLVLLALLQPGSSFALTISPPDAAASASPRSGESDATASLRSAASAAVPIKRIKPLPFHAISLVELQDGRIYLQSSDGRLVVYGGHIMDMLEGRAITSMEDASSFDLVYLDKLGFRPSDFVHYNVGHGVDTVVVFFDPSDPSTSTLFQQSEALSDKFTFVFVLTPFRGKLGADQSVQLACLKDQDAAKRVLFGRGQALSSLPQAPANCPVEKLQKAMIMARVAGAAALPFLVLPSHKTLTRPTGTLSAILN